jgi:guanylate kinase
MSNKANHKGLLIIFSSASGAGKTTIAKGVAEKDPNLMLSVSYTTRLPRGKEKNGKDYFFVSEDQFEQMIKEGEFLEWEKVHDAFYGTSHDFVRENLSRGKDVILIIDVKGAKRIKEKYSDSISFFFRTPSVDELKKRLRKRGTETKESLARRIEIADWEEKQAKDYNYHIVNDKIEDAVNEVLSIIKKERKKI